MHLSCGKARVQANLPCQSVSSCRILHVFDMKACSKSHLESVAVSKSGQPNTCTSCAAAVRLCKIARQLIDGGDLPDPPERPPKGKGGGKDGGKDDGERGERGLTTFSTWT